jgi:hypothetical protein
MSASAPRAPPKAGRSSWPSPGPISRVLGTGKPPAPGEVWTATLNRWDGTRPARRLTPGGRIRRRRNRIRTTPSASASRPRPTASALRTAARAVGAVNGWAVKGSQVSAEPRVGRDRGGRNQCGFPSEPNHHGVRHGRSCPPRSRRDHRLPPPHLHYKRCLVGLWAC